MNTKRISPAIYLPRPFIRLYYPVVYHQVILCLPLGRAIRLYAIKLHYQTLTFTLPLILTLTQHCYITKSLGSQIRQRNQIEIPPLQVLCQLPPMVNALEQHWIQPTSLIKKSNKYQKARRCCVQHAIRLDLITEIPRPQCLRSVQSTVLGWFYFIGFLQFARQWGFSDPARSEQGKADK